MLNKIKSQSENIVLAITVISGIISMFKLLHRDTLCIVFGWEDKLCDCILSGTVNDFQTILLHDFNPSNYSMFFNFMAALWIMPSKLLYEAGILPAEAMIYWYKCLLLLFALLSLVVIRKIMILLNAPDKIRMAQIMYFGSPMLLISILGKGQVDSIGVFFFLLAIQFYLEERYFSMSLMVGLSMLIKPFAIIFYIPALILIFYRSGIFTLIYAAIPFLIYKAEYDLRDRLVKNYNDYSAILTYRMVRKKMGLPFADRIFEISLNEASVFLCTAMILCGVLYFVSRDKRISKGYALICGVLVFSALVVLMQWSTAWIVYSVIPVALLVILFICERDGFLLFMTWCLSYCFFCVTRYKDQVTVFGREVAKKHSLLGGRIIESYDHIPEISLTVMFVSMILICVVSFMALQKKTRDTKRGISTPALVLLPMITIVYTLIQAFI